MYKHLKAELFKLIHSYIFYLLPILFIVLFIILTQTTDGIYILYSNWGKDSMGFFAFIKSDNSIYSISDLVNTVISPSWGIWILMMILTISTFYKDYTLGTIRLSYNCGISTVAIVFSKIITIILYFSLCYFIFSFICALYCVSYMSIKLNFIIILEIFKATFLCYLIFIAFSITCVFITALINSILLSTTIISIGTLVSAYLLIVTWDPSVSTPFYLLISPMYYLMSIAHRNILGEILLYCACNFFLLLPASIMLLKKKIIT